LVAESLPKIIVTSFSQSLLSRICHQKLSKIFWYPIKQFKSGVKVSADPRPRLWSTTSWKGNQSFPVPYRPFITKISSKSKHRCSRYPVHTLTNRLDHRTSMADLSAQCYCSPRVLVLQKWSCLYIIVFAVQTLYTIQAIKLHSIFTNNFNSTSYTQLQRRIHNYLRVALPYAKNWNVHNNRAISFKSKFYFQCVQHLQNRSGTCCVLFATQNTT